MRKSIPLNKKVSGRVFIHYIFVPYLLTLILGNIVQSVFPEFFGDSFVIVIAIILLILIVSLLIWKRIKTEGFRLK